MRPTQKHLAEQLFLAQQAVRSGTTYHPDLTYEDGVLLCLEWMMGGKTPPIDASEEHQVQSIAPAPRMEDERIAVLRLAARVSNPTLLACLQRIAREWPLDDVRNFLSVYSEQRVARAALLAIAADTTPEYTRQILAGRPLPAAVRGSRAAG
jgi:hypothetical protein